MNPRIAELTAQGWRTAKCQSCRGYGVVSDYRGGDFNGAMECGDCAGGTVWITPSGTRTALYPGGPFTGWWYE